MSLSDDYGMNYPAPWSLDELVIEDIFTPVVEAETVSSAQVERTYTSDEVEALVNRRIAEIRPNIEAEAWAKGHQAGMTEARERMHEQVHRSITALAEAASAISEHESRWLANLEENLAASAVTIARHLMDREVNADPSLVMDLVSRSLKQFHIETQLTVRLNPEDHDLVQDAIAAGYTGFGSDRNIRWQSDPHVVRGGCLVDGRERVLDGRVDTALERIYRSLSQVQA